jgi:hypothetical protein
LQFAYGAYQAIARIIEGDILGAFLRFVSAILPWIGGIVGTLIGGPVGTAIGTGVGLAGSVWLENYEAKRHEQFMRDKNAAESQRIASENNNSPLQSSSSSSPQSAMPSATPQPSVTPQPSATPSVGGKSATASVIPAPSSSPASDAPQRRFIPLQPTAAPTPPPVPVIVAPRATPASTPPVVDLSADSIFKLQESRGASSVIVGGSSGGGGGDPIESYRKIQTGNMARQPYKP